MFGSVPSVIVFNEPAFRDISKLAFGYFCCSGNWLLVCTLHYFELLVLCLRLAVMNLVRFVGWVARHSGAILITSVALAAAVFCCGWVVAYRYWYLWFQYRLMIHVGHCSLWCADGLSGSFSSVAAGLGRVSSWSMAPSVAVILINIVTSWSGFASLQV